MVPPTKCWPPPWSSNHISDVHLPQLVQSSSYLGDPLVQNMCTGTMKEKHRGKDKVRILQKSSELTELGSISPDILASHSSPPTVTCISPFSTLSMNIPWRENGHEGVSTMAKAKQTSQLDTQKLEPWIEMRLLLYYCTLCKLRE